MPLLFSKNPMYALCLLAAICVRQHVRSNRAVQPLTTNVSLQNPTSRLMKPDTMSLGTATDWGKKSHDENNAKINQADSLVQCVQNFAKRAQHIVGDLRMGLPMAKSSDDAEPFPLPGILYSLLYLTSSVGIKWLA